MDNFLKDVPADKLFVHGNYRSLTSGAFFIRNSKKGRKFVRDWLSIAMSGYVTCHGYDQVRSIRYSYLAMISDGIVVGSAASTVFTETIPSLTVCSKPI